ncbi:MAG: hypothetical protein J6386_23630 [Candidatus Synoicihabitans palmerolidicus]|nr:hypothetical protein [Candidatus Synoicihabitans palmerolidicus]
MAAFTLPRVNFCVIFCAKRKSVKDIAALRDGVLQGYQDLNAGHTVEFTGDPSLKAADKREDQGWQ